MAIFADQQNNSTDFDILRHPGCRISYEEKTFWAKGRKLLKNGSY